MNKSLEASNANQTMTAGAFTATLKGKINGLEETIKALQEELNFYKKEIQTLRSEKEQLDDSLTRKAQEIRKSLTTEVIKAEEDMKKSYLGQKNENNKLQNQITTLKTEKTNLQQHLLDLQRRTAELELQIGAEVDNPQQQ
uniref:Uncharacterized protein n=1 Tax=Strombidium rassoulzadegani TaxID=1082188 RepID=A0A7S3CPX5_9SPIT|mmetsp:Transcript_2826/g.4831  ORF Transcript_2826/g.4831 Transcript_2826/m.4831 type:complete len:141 (+) Transcript_2826:3-425(+)